MYHYTHTQKEWLEKATSEELKLFLSKGPATCDMVLMTKALETKYVPMIRGMRFKGTFDLAEDAVKKAQSVLKNIQGNIKDKTFLDEHALGIDGKNARYLDQCDENEVRISGIFHLASVLGTDEMENSFLEFIDDFVDHLFSKTGHHESMLPLIPENPDNEDDQNFLKEMLHDHWLKEGFFGFAIQVTTPVYENNMSSGWGYCRQQWFYAETYGQAFDLAMEWSRKDRP